MHSFHNFPAKIIFTFQSWPKRLSKLEHCFRFWKGLQNLLSEIKVGQFLVDTWPCQIMKQLKYYFYLFASSPDSKDDFHQPYLVFKETDSIIIETLWNLEYHKLVIAKNTHSYLLMSLQISQIWFIFYTNDLFLL